MIFLYSTSIGLRYFEPAARLVFVRLRIDLRPVRFDMQQALMRIEPARSKNITVFRANHYRCVSKIAFVRRSIVSPSVTLAIY